MPPPATAKTLQSKLLAWYDAEGRDLPWRVRGRAADPYRVWLSEIMLQQTQVATVIPYYQNFLTHWPGVHDLAAASLDSVLRRWAGLGYYARARNLHKCAKVVSRELDGVFPDTEEGLRALPGIGPYTAAAIAAIAFGRKATVVDGNVERVMARLHNIRQPLPKSKPVLRALAADLTPRARPGDHAQAVMDLGATLCTPRAPACPGCPWARACKARAAGTAADLPRRAAKPERGLRRGVVFWLRRDDGAVLLRRRAEKGLLGGMMEVPSTPWDQTAWEIESARHHEPWPADWRALPGAVRHTFSHFHLELEVVAATLPDNPAPMTGHWCPLDQLKDQALPSVMRKVVRLALAGQGD